MPELPEVETMASQIRYGYLGLRIVRVKTRPGRIFRNISAAGFSRSLTGKYLRRVERYGKFMFWQVDEAYPLFHMGMSGIFINDLALSRFPRHVHISLYFQGGRELHFQDARKFGKVFLFTHPPDFSRLGIDPSRENFTLNNFRKLLNLKKAGIKSLLMDQQVIAGIGNIYASEALFAAGIHPSRPAPSLSLAETRRLHRAIVRVLKQAIDSFGTTYTAYRTVDGSPGENQNFLQVYQREGDTCRRCGGKIQKLIINSRSTFYCRSCQI